MSWDKKKQDVKLKQIFLKYHASEMFKHIRDSLQIPKEWA